MLEVATEAKTHWVINALPSLTTEEWLEQHNLLEIEDVIETS